MSALGGLVVKLSLDYAEYVKGWERADQSSLKFAQTMETRVIGAMQNVASAFAAVAVAKAGFFATLISQAIDAQDELAKLSRSSGVAVDSMAGLKFASEQSGTSIERTAKGVRMFSTLVVEAGNKGGEAASKINRLGLSVDELLKLSPEERFLKLAGALSEFAEEDQAVALTSTLGDRMAELVPLLSSGEDGLRAMMEEGKRLNPVTRESVEQAERFNDSVDVLKREAISFVQVATVNLIPALSNIATSMKDAAREGDALDIVIAGVSQTVKELFGTQSLGQIHQVRTEIFKTQEALAELEKRRAGRFGFVVSEQEIEFEKAKLGSLNAELQRLLRAREELQKQQVEQVNKPRGGPPIPGIKPEELEKRIRHTRTLISEQERLEKALAEEGRRLTEQLDPLAKRTAEFERYQQLRDAGAISQEIYDQATQKSMDDYLKALGFVELEVEKVKETHERMHSAVRHLYGDMSQFAIQAARNIHSAFADFLFDPFSAGLKGMLTGFANILRRMAAEVAASRIMQGLGMGSLFGSGSAFAAGGAGTGASLLDMASLGSSALNLVQGGFGASSMAGSFAMSGMGQSLGLSAKMGGTGMGFITPAGTAFSGAAGMLGAGALGVMGGSLLAGDKQIAGINGTISSVGGAAIGAAIAGPVGAAVGGVLGGAINAAFGRGPLKQRATTLSGTLGAGGFEDGALRTDFRAKGGWFRSNKNDFAQIDVITGQIETDNAKLNEYAANLASISRDVIGLINDTVGAVGSSLYQIGDGLGLSTEALQNFRTEINLVSENGQFLTQEQIGQEIERITGSLARSLVPELDELAKRGETAMQTIARINAEFNLLTVGATALGRSVAESHEMISAMTMSQRTEFVQSMGGMDIFASRIETFSARFLSAEQRLAPAVESATDLLRQLGLEAINTRDKFAAAVQSFGREGGITQDQFAGLLSLVETADTIFSYLESMEQQAGTDQSIAQNAQQIAQQRYALESQLLQQQGDTIALRQRELDALDPSNRAILERIHLLQDEQAAQQIAQQNLQDAQRAAQQIAQQRYTLESQLLQQQGDTIALRQREIDAIDPSNRAILERIHLIQDEQASRQAAESMLSNAYGILQDQVRGGTAQIAKEFDALINGIDESIRSANDNVSALRSITDMLHRSTAQLRDVSASEARGQVQAATRQMAVGATIDPGSLRDALTSLERVDASGFATREDFVRQSAQDAALLSDLWSVADDQLSAELRMIKSLELQSEQLREQSESEQQILHDMLGQIGEQIDAARGIDKTISGLLGMGGPIAQAIMSLSGNITRMQQDSLQRPPGFASGGYHSGGARIVGERGPELEVTGPSRIYSNSDTRSIFDVSSIVAAIERMNVKIDEMQRDTRKTSDTLVRVTRDGSAMVTA